MDLGWKCSDRLQIVLQQLYVLVSRTMTAMSIFYIVFGFSLAKYEWPKLSN